MPTVAEHTQVGSLHKRRVNDLIRESLQTHAKSEQIGFFCECASERCFDVVPMTAEEYELGRLTPGWSPRAPGH